MNKLELSASVILDRRSSLYRVFVVRYADGKKRVLPIVVKVDEKTGNIDFETIESVMP